jgi:hypothetical protein
MQTSDYDAKKLQPALHLAAEYRRKIATGGPSADTIQIRSTIEDLVGYRDHAGHFCLPTPVREAMGLES